MQRLSGLNSPINRIRRANNPSHYENSKTAGNFRVTAIHSERTLTLLGTRSASVVLLYNRALSGVSGSLPYHLMQHLKQKLGQLSGWRISNENEMY